MSEEINKTEVLALLDEKHKDATNRRETLSSSDIKMTPKEMEIAWFSLLAREMVLDEIKKTIKEM